MILVTGSSGFVGKQLINTLVKTGIHTRGVGRKSAKETALPNYSYHAIDDFSSRLDWQYALQDVEIVVHTIARVHIMDEKVPNIEDYRKCNVDATLHLAKQAAKAGVKRFIYLSSIGVNGNITQEGQAFDHKCSRNPYTPYTQSKNEAELGLIELIDKTAMEIVIIRPPLVYGPYAPGNFRTLRKLVIKQWPLPFGNIDNKRSFIALENLIDFIMLCIDRQRSPQAANQIFVISDDEDISTTQLLQKVAQAYQKKQCLIPIPIPLMQFVSKLLGKNSVTDKLFKNLQVDCSKAKELLGWEPIISMDEQLVKMAKLEQEQQ